MKGEERFGVGLVVPPAPLASLVSLAAPQAAYMFCCVNAVFVVAQLGSAMRRPSRLSARRRILSGQEFYLSNGAKTRQGDLVQ